MADIFVTRSLVSACPYGFAVATPPVDPSPTPCATCGDQTGNLATLSGLTGVCAIINGPMNPAVAGGIGSCAWAWVRTIPAGSNQPDYAFLELFYNNSGSNLALSYGSCNLVVPHGGYGIRLEIDDSDDPYTRDQWAENATNLYCGVNGKIQGYHQFGPPCVPFNNLCPTSIPRVDFSG